MCFRSMPQLNLDWKHLNNGHYLSNRLQKLGSSIQVNISLYILFFVNVTATTVRLKASNIDSFVTGPGRFLSCFHCGLAFQQVDAQDCIWKKTLSIQSRLHSSAAKRTYFCRGQVIFVSFEKLR